MDAGTDGLMREVLANEAEPGTWRGDEAVVNGKC
jgi:hypothetical protein